MTLQHFSHTFRLYFSFFCYQPGFLAFLINGNWSEARQEIQARLYWGPCCSRGEWEQTTGSFACSLPEWGWACSLRGVRVGVCPGVGLEGWLRWFAHPLVRVSCRGRGSTLLLLQALQKWQLGFLVSLYVLSRICPNCACRQLFFVPYSFFVFCCSRRGVSRCKHCSTAAKGPRSQPVSLLLFLPHLDLLPLLKSWTC